MSRDRRAYPNPTTVSSAGRPRVVPPDRARARDDRSGDEGAPTGAPVADRSEAMWRGTTLPDPTDALNAIWGIDTHPPDPRITTDALDAIWTADTHPPDPRITTDALDAIWTADTRPSGPTAALSSVGAGGRLLSPGTVEHRRRARTHPHGQADAGAPSRTPIRRSRLAVACRAVGGGLSGLVALAVAWLVLVPLRYEPRVAYRDAVAAHLDAAVAETLTTDHLLAVATWVGYIATTLVLGGLVFERFVARRPVRLRLGAAVLLGLVAAATALPLRAAEVSGDGLTAIADPEVLRLVATSAFGGAIALRAAGLLLLGASLGGAPAGQLRRASRIAGGTTLVASYLMIGHPQATDPAVIEVIALVVHLLAVATWFGGVAVLATELRPGTVAGRRLPAAAISRFSRIAEVMVVLVLGSGLVLAEGQGALNTAPWHTGYGLALTVKLCFVAVVLAIGGYNRVQVVPAIAERDGAAARRHLRTTCVVEALVISMGVLLMTAAMTSGGF